MCVELALVERKPPNKQRFDRVSTQLAELMGKWWRREQRSDPKGERTVAVVDWWWVHCKREVELP